MNETIGERVEAYLSGDLSPKQSEDFERDLAKPEVAQAFGQALMIREMLQKAPPDDVPQDLLTRIEQDVLDQLEDVPEETQDAARSGARAILDGLAWTVRGPSLALNMGGSGGEAAASGFGTTRYALGPLAFSKRTKKNKKSLGKRGLGLLGRVVRRRK